MKKRVDPKDSFNTMFGIAVLCFFCVISMITMKLESTLQTVLVYLGMTVCLGMHWVAVMQRIGTLV